jgi:hypothetical protein
MLETWTEQVSCWRKRRSLGGGGISFFLFYFLSFFFLLLTSVGCRFTDMFQKARPTFGWAVRIMCYEESVYRMTHRMHKKYQEKSIVLLLHWNILRFRPLVLLKIAAWTWEWVWSIAVMKLATERSSICGTVSLCLSQNSNGPDKAWSRVSAGRFRQLTPWSGSQSKECRNA